MNIEAAGEILNGRFNDSRDDVFFQSVDDVEYTYSDLLINATRLRDVWRGQNVKPGDVVAFKLENGFALPCCYMACALGSYIACPIVPSLSNETIQMNLADMKPSLYVEDQLDFEFEIGDAVDPTQMDAIDYTIPFLIMFSSGSTGKNKAICHCLGAVLGSAASFAKLSGMNRNTSLYHVLPMTYMAGFLNAMLSVFAAGGKVVEGPQFSMETVADFWSRPLATDANVLSIIPPIAAAVCRLTRDAEKIKKVSEQFQQVQCTSQAIPADLKKRFFDKFGLPLQDCYGMTELGGPLSFQQQDDALAFNSQSTTLPEIDFNCDEGELHIRSPFSMLGYLNDGELDNPFDEAGFLNTGDLAASPARQTIEITGRAKDIIIPDGVNTSPARIESVMSEFETIDEASVLGLPHDFWGEEIVACVITSAETSEGDILDYCRQHLDSHEVPDRILFMQEFPRSFIGKVLKADLQAKVLEQQEQA